MNKTKMETFIEFVNFRNGYLKPCVFLCIAPIESWFVVLALHVSDARCVL